MGVRFSATTQRLLPGIRLQELAQTKRGFMTRIIGLAIALCAVTTSGHAQTAHTGWRIFASGGGITFFYSVPTIKRTSQNERNPRRGKVRVWTEQLSTKALANIRPTQRGIYLVALRIAHGYRPPILKIFPAASAINMAGAEEVADEGTVPLKGSEYTEIDCATGRFRVLTEIRYTENGNIKGFASGHSAWIYYPPQSVEDDLATLICNKRLTTSSAGVSKSTTH